MSNLIKKIRTQSGDAQIDYESLANLPVPDKTLTQEGKAADAKEVGDRLGQLSDDIDDLKENGVSGGSGLYIGATQPTNGVAFWIDTSSDTPSEEPSTPTTPTLTSITATYSGGDVTVGTSVNSLSGITVKGNYSDGTTQTVTDYTLSGSIVEGANTITVTYQGMTTTFTVNGVISAGGDTPSSTVKEITPSYLTFNVRGASVTDVDTMASEMPQTMSFVAKNVQEYWRAGASVKIRVRDNGWTYTDSSSILTTKEIVLNDIRYGVLTFTKDDFNVAYQNYQTNLSNGLIYVSCDAILGNNASRFDSTRNVKAFDGEVTEDVLSSIEW